MAIVVKGDGTREVFELSKLEHSLARSGAPQEVVARVARSIGDGVRDGMTTSDIYRRAHALLGREERTFAARYSVRRALLDMGPTGYPFEDYFCELMRAKGYTASVRQIIEGRCTTHEVDVVLARGDENIGCELKFHNVPGFKTDLKTALYVRARFGDIEDRARDLGQTCDIREGWLVTNTKFTAQAIEYAECAGIRLLGWSYPGRDNLADIIEETGLYPITVLTTISKKEEALLLKNQVTLCRDVARDPSVLTRAGIPRRKHATIVAESMSLCGAS